ncbi:hypothetical protein [Nocardia vinacea]|uniref:hypothetical protein n=1 Tax=Nocardia vinacea TaxID=96468 RepID=UPI0012F6A5E7|nr:hypothetical protein [Nocardia vinacea]
MATWISVITVVSSVSACVRAAGPRPRPLVLTAMLWPVGAPAVAASLVLLVAAGWQVTPG